MDETLEKMKDEEYKEQFKQNEKKHRRLYYLVIGITVAFNVA